MTAAIALDLGTTSIKAGLLAHDGTLGGIVARPAPTIVVHDGRYESDGLAYAAAADAVLAECLAQTNARQPLGLCSQRSSFLLWERAGGQPVTPLISWQDDRGAASCEVLRKNEPVIRALTGLPLTPYYLAPKLRVLLREHPTWREKLVSGVWLLGTLDTFLIWRWSGGKRHQTDASMAARTLLMDIRRGGWSPELCTLFDIPPQVLPQLTPSVGLDLPLQNGLHLRRGGAEPSGAGQRSCGVGSCAQRVMPEPTGASHFLPQSADFVGNVSEVHLQASVGDQSAALLAAIGEGQPEALVNLGTGGFVVCYLPEGCSAPDGYLQTLVWQDGAQQRHQAVEGTLNSIAAALADYPAAACRVEDLAQDDIFCLAEPSGLGAPYFRKDLGLTFSAPVGHLPPQRIAALLLEGILFRVVRILEDFRREFGLERVYLSGGLSHLPALRQGLAHLVGAQLLLGDNCSGKTSSRSNSCAPAPDVSEVRPRHGGAEPSGAGADATHFLPQSAGFASNVSEVRLLAQKEASLEGVARLAAGIVQPVAGQGGKIDGGPPLPALAAKYQRWKVWLERLLAG